MIFITDKDGEDSDFTSNVVYEEVFCNIKYKQYYVRVNSTTPTIYYILLFHTLLYNAILF